MYPTEHSAIPSAGRTVRLDDDTEVLVRPVRPEDAESFYWFLGGLDPEERKYLRIDVTDRNLVLDRIRNESPATVVRLIALADREIVGEGLLEVSRDHWESEIGEMRLLVAPDYRKRGLGRRLAREIYFRAVEMRLRKLVARLMRPQVEVRRVCRRLGFTEGAVLPDLATDMEGRRQDVVVMTLDIEELKKDLADHNALNDMRIRR